MIWSKIEFKTVKALTFKDLEEEIKRVSKGYMVTDVQGLTYDSLHNEYIAICKCCK